jgi:G3E family GTPase
MIGRFGLAKGLNEPGRARRYGYFFDGIGMTQALLPVTILTGFLGSGKTTLLKRILSEPHGLRIAVIENEFGAEGVDNELLVQSQEEQIVEMNNGCICCTVRGDLVRILGDLRARREQGLIAFDRVVIETTGLADPGPVAQTFFIEDAVAGYYLLDAIITVVDAVHGGVQLDAHREAVEQVGFADRILLSKVDVADYSVQQRLQERLRRINSRAPILPMVLGDAPIDQVLDIRGFNLNSALEIAPDFLGTGHHDHDDAVSSFVFRSARPFDARKLEDFLGGLVQVYGPDMLRYKGVLFVKGSDRQLVLQGVQMMMGSDLGRPWPPGEKPQSRMVFIGRKLPEELFIQGLQQCLA